MTDPDDIVAMLYEIGGRRDTNGSRPLRRSEFDDLTADHDDGPVPEAAARAAYRSRIASRALRRGGTR